MANFRLNWWELETVGVGVWAMVGVGVRGGFWGVVGRVLRCVVVGRGYGRARRGGRGGAYVAR